MKRVLRSAVGVMMAASLLATANRAQAVPISRDQLALFFNLHQFDFGPADAGTLTDGIVSVAATLDDTFSVDTFVPSSAVESAPGIGIRLDFSPQPGGRIFAVGIDFLDTPFFPQQPSIATVRVFSPADVLLESVTVLSVDTAGFIGVQTLPFPPFLIGHVIVSSGYTPDDPFYSPLRIDNIMYVQSIRQPEPATLTLTALGLAGVAMRHRRRVH